MSKGIVQGISSSVAAALLSQSVLEAVVPISPDCDTLSLLADEDASPAGAATSLIRDVPHRKTLYLDELIPVHIILKAPFVAEASFKAWLARLSVKLDAYAVGTHPGPRQEGQHNGRQSAPNQNIKEVVDGCVVDSGSDPLIAVGTEAGDDSDTGPAKKAKKSIYILWKEELHISRARLRSRDLSIYLSATCSLLPSSPGTTDEVLTTGQTSSPNLFAALSHDPSFHGRPPVLTAARLSKHIPAGFVDQNIARPIKNTNRPLMHTVPAMSTKLRCLRAGSSPNASKLLANIDIETHTALRRSQASLDSVELLFSDGKAIAVSPTPLPHTMSAGNSTAFLYDLVPTAAARRSAAQQRTTAPAEQHSLTFRLKSTIHDPDLTELGGVYPRRISTQWRTTVDTGRLHESSRTAPGAAPQRIPTGSKSKRTTLINPASTNNRAPTLVLAITASPSPVLTSSATTWTIQLSNQSGAHASLAPGTKPAAPRSLRLRLIPLVDASDPAALLPLVPSLSIPRLLPGASTTVALRLRAPALAGVCRFVGLRVEDLDAMNTAERDDVALKGRSAVIVGEDMVPDVVAVDEDDAQLAESVEKGLAVR